MDELYSFLQQTLMNAALKVLGTTRSRAKPTMTDDIKGLLDIAKKLYKEAALLPPGVERNQAKLRTQEAYTTFRTEHRRHLKLNDEEFMLP